ncbi:DUF4124 domain-containing protein [Vibrio sp. LaRot3]|uniref:DUF4124 domain-containing protein n=1 Tax=Vibrio sp. LaRot3 TaxID=2998829 RepID=UPI0022CDC90C|nr:DUF4124 domain-containing protein [Vibrio sp. LaRot3]MDA0149321.1 DUF4124 domain-containing protein [Vibrio sp. LaRot3]
MTIFLRSVLLGLLLTSYCHAQTAYTWVDDKGVLHFSDSPDNPNATSLDLPKHQQAAPAPELLPETPPPNADTPEQQAQTDQPLELTPKPLTISFLQPAHDQAIRSNSGKLTIQAQINRDLAVTEHLQLMFDGKPYGAPQIEPLWQLKNVDRGSHVIAIQAIRDGKQIALSPTITVHVQRAKVKPA